MCLRIVEAIWEAAGYPWSVRLKALLPLWLPWAEKRLGELPPDVRDQVQSIRARQIDRRLASKKRRRKRRLYGRTKPGTLLRREIPVQPRSRPAPKPGLVEVDGGSHSGPSASGEFGYSLNLTDLYTGWCVTRAILGKSQHNVVEKLEEMRQALPFKLVGLHSDNGSEFINEHLWRYCRKHGIVFTRSRPYKKDDNAHIEQKNWTHVRRVFGWDRYDRPEVIAAMNDVYAVELELMMNGFQPSVKLQERCRVGSRLRRRYEAAQTPLERLVRWYKKTSLPAVVRDWRVRRDRTDPFELSARIDEKLRRSARLLAWGHPGW